MRLKLSTVLPLLSLSVASGAAAQNQETGRDRRTDGVALSYESASRYASLFSGAATYDVPIELPPGPGGFAPALALAYNSDRGNGWLGLGWDVVGLHRIERSSRRGVPSYVDPCGEQFSEQLYDSFELMLEGRHFELFWELDADRFVTHPVAHHEVTFVCDVGSIASFRVRDRSGTSYVFEGLPAAGRSGSRFYPVTEAFDRNGNLIRYAYDVDAAGGDYYPETITYGLTRGAVLAQTGDDRLGTTRTALDTPAPAAEPIRVEVRFSLERRRVDLTEPGCVPGPAHEVVDDYRGGSRRRMDQRITGIRAVRRPLPNASWESAPLPPLPRGMIADYELSYDSACRGHQSLLTEVRRVGFSRSLRYRFTYHGTTAAGEGFREVMSRPIPSPSVGGVPDLWPQRSEKGETGQFLHAGVRWVDVNGDALADMVWGLENHGRRWSASRVGGQALARAPLSWSPLNQSTRFYEAIGDEPGPSGFPAPLAEWDRNFHAGFAGTELVDVNADGFVDILHSFRNEDGDERRSTWINDRGRGWKLDSGWRLPLLYATRRGSAGTEIHDLKIVDVDGDAFPDLVSGPQGTFLSRGGSGQKGWQAQPDARWRTPAPVLPNRNAYFGFFAGGYVDLGVRYVDLNGDGLQDVLVFRNENCSLQPGSDGLAQRCDHLVNEAWVNTGHVQANGSVYGKDDRWRVPQNQYLPGELVLGQNVRGTHLATQILDLNRDGLPDLLFALEGARKVVFNTPSGWAGPISANPLAPASGGSDPNAWIDLIPAFAVRSSGSTEVRYVDDGVSLADFDGDGAADIGRSRERFHGQRGHGQFDFVEKQVGIWLNDFRRPLLIAAETPYGAVLRYEYASSHGQSGVAGPTPHLAHADANGVHRMPDPKPLVAALEMDAGVDGPIRVRFSYRGGRFDFATREFRGFRQVTVLPGDGTGDSPRAAEEIYRFFQDDERRGRVISRRTGRGAVYAEALYDYDTRSGGTGARSWAYETLPATTHALSYDGIDAQRDLILDLDFDAAGRASVDPWLDRGPAESASAGVSWSDEAVAGRALHLTAGSARVAIPVGPLTLQDGVALHAWLRPETGPGSAAGRRDVVGLAGSFLLYLDDQDRFGVAVRTGGRWRGLSSTHRLPRSRYSHVVFDHDGGSTARLFVDGALQGEWSDVGQLTAGNELHVGARSAGATTLYRGHVDGVKLFRRPVRVPRITRSSLSYDAYGNPVSSWLAGDLADPGDDVVVATEYRSIPGHILDRPVHTEVRAGSRPGAETATASWYGWDDLGNLRRAIAWGGALTGDGRPRPDAPDNPVTRFAYDARGNLVRVTDPLGRVTRLDYAAAFPARPTAIVDALGRAVRIDYYGLEAGETDEERYLGLFGQVKRVTGADGSTTRYVYDRLGWLRAVYGPLDGDLADAHLYPSLLLSYGSVLAPSGAGRELLRVHLAARTEPLEDADPALTRLREALRTHGRRSVTTAGGVFDENYFAAAERNPGVTTAVAYYDGFGRPVSSVGEADAENTAILAGFARHDGLGRPVALYPPSFTVGGNLYGTNTSTLSPAAPEFLRTDLAYRLPDPGGTHADVAYDAIGRVTQVQGPDGALTSYTYDQRTVTEIDPNGHKTDRVFDAFGRLVEVVQYPGRHGIQAEGGVAVLAPEQADRATPTLAQPDFSSPAPAEAVIGTVLTAELPLRTRYAYDALGNLTSVRDPAGNEVELRHDPLGRRTGLLDPDLGGRPGEIQTESGVVTVPGRTWSYRYDLAGNLVEILDPKGQRSGVDYDALDRPVARRQYDLQPWVAAHEGAGPASARLFTTSGLWHRTSHRTAYFTGASFAFNHEATHGYAGGRTVRGELVLGPVDLGEFLEPELAFSFFWDTRPSAAPQVDVLEVSASADGETWVVLADDTAVKGSHPPRQWGTLGGLDLDAYAGGPVWVRFTFDSVTPPGSAAREGWYVNEVKIEAKRLVDAHPPTRFRYDDTGIGGPHAVGRLVEMTDASGWTRYRYDPRGRVLAIRRRLGGQQFEAGFTWDGLDRLTSITYPTTGGGRREVVSYEYGRDGLVRSMKTSEPRDVVREALYDALGRLRRVRFGNGLETRYSYDDAPQGHQGLSRIVTGRFAAATLANRLAVEQQALLQDVGYGYDAGGRAVWSRDAVRPERSGIYSYDALDRLVASQRGSEVHRYGYDVLGNLTRMGSDTLLYEQTGSAGPRSVTRLSRAGGDPDLAFSYDTNGNPTQVTEGFQPSTAYTYDHANRLTGIGASTRFVYDGVGRRVEKGEGRRETLYPFPFYGIDGEVPVSHYLFGGPVATRRHAGRGRGAGGLVYLHPDRAGSLSLATDEAGRERARIDYEPFGALRTEEGTAPGNLRFAGKERDASGLYDFGARFYDPRIGRFLTPDPFYAHLREMAVGGAQELNLYAYADNDPVNRMDPTGLQANDLPADQGKVQPGWGLYVDRSCSPNCAPEPAAEPAIHHVFAPEVITRSDASGTRARAPRRPLGAPWDYSVWTLSGEGLFGAGATGGWSLVITKGGQIGLYEFAPPPGRHLNAWGLPSLGVSLSFARGIRLRENLFRYEGLFHGGSVGLGGGVQGQVVFQTSGDPTSRKSVVEGGGGLGVGLSLPVTASYSKTYYRLIGSYKILEPVISSDPTLNERIRKFLPYKIIPTRGRSPRGRR